MRDETLSTYQLGRAHGTWSGRLLSPWEWAFLECHRLHDERDEIMEKAKREVKVMTSVLDLVTALKTDNIDDANHALGVVRARWFGDAPPPDKEDSDDPRVMTFRNGSAVFSYDARLEQDDAFPKGEELVAFLAGDDQDEE